MGQRIVVFALGVLVLSAGCASSTKSLPQTYPVNGKVVDADGRPMSGGVIMFKPESKADVTTTGSIQPDGSFTLITVVENQKVDGVIAGPYTVTILPPLGQDQRAAAGGAPQPVQLRETIIVKSDGANTLTLTLPRGR
jgi:hypothetical protein